MSTTTKQRVLVTGSSGFLGGHVVERLLRAGYAVRGAIRSVAKAQQLKTRFNHSDYDIVVVDDLVAGDFSAALKGVSSVIHLASPLFSGGHHVQVAVEGTMNVLRQAYASGVYKFTVLSSYAATFTNSAEMFDSSITITDTDWRQIDEEALKNPNLPANAAYSSSKALAERAAWEFAEAHPEIDLVTLLPVFLYGPPSPYHVVTGMDNSLSTDINIYKLLSGKNSQYPVGTLPQYVDVRDVAQSVVLTLSTTPAPGQQRRILLCAGSFSWKQAVRHIAAVRPGLKSRLIDGGEPEGNLEVSAATLDTSKAAEVLGITKYIGWEKMLEDTVDSLLKLETNVQL
ncbi:NAD(P)-binding protein [Hysterangium stoloniferum]|nr:NAD(P)-binding protein [Hysterangium stoloniferum]